MVRCYTGGPINLRITKGPWQGQLWKRKANRPEKKEFVRSPIGKSQPRRATRGGSSSVPLSFSSPTDQVSHLSNQIESVTFSSFCTASSRTGAHSNVIMLRMYLERCGTFRAPCSASSLRMSMFRASSISFLRRFWRGNSSDSKIYPGKKSQRRSCILFRAPNFL